MAEKDNTHTDTAGGKREDEFRLLHEELTAAYEEITASEEELRQQCDELLRREEDIRRQNSILTSLHETAMGLMKRVALKDVLTAIVSHANDLIGTSHGFINILDAEQGVFERKVGLGHYAQDIGRKIKLTEGFGGQVYKSGAITVVDDYSASNRRLDGSFFDHINQVVLVPLKRDDTVIAIFGLSFLEPDRSFSDQEISLLVQFAQLASMALDNALLVDSLEKELRERRVQEQKNWRLAYYDSLTGLPNRAYVYARLAEEFDKAGRGKTSGAILHIDLDDLKLINDTLGHSIGDEIIVKAGEYIVAGAGEHALVARIAGDEFMILLVGESDREKVAHIADTVVRQLSREYAIGESRVHMSGSIGIAFYPDDGDTAADVLKKADLALHEAKISGKNTWRFCKAKLQIVAYENMVLKQELREAIEHEELSLYYQPIVDAGSGRIVSFEALLRWTNSAYGAVPPSRFIPLAEENDTIQRVGKWVIEEACRFARQLAEMGKCDIRVSVNVSPRQIIADDFVAVVCQAIDRAGISPSQLEVEITENALIASLEDSTQKLRELRNIGVGLSLDDFGTGYSSLTYLRNLPVGTLKIDKSFIDPMVSDAVQLQFICSIVNMAHVLGLTVVAEGVETEEQLAKLVQCQCDFIQGYVFSRPLAEKEAILLTFNKDLFAKV
ncbi:hypothetical protein AXX12_11685 [Anaerosporomusa subterranea]|uniref:Diguanylate cyclase n=1 Tax=Anaerosporomusa subterranea TaxID=1794912 RepID=A0A154BPR2_ANASB|nr:GGDEF domain-containing protein [Anaerosporomusa subterranea]KYZ75850.1 hypothetical protein AXX12_11685 [Anaerosporomusa subterranea]